MPTVGTDRINADTSLLSSISEWVIEYGRGGVGYQYVAKQVFVYRIPTMGQLLDLEVAEAQDPIFATNAFLKSIALSKIPRMKQADVVHLMEAIVKEHFPSGEDGLRMDLLKYTHSHMNTLVGAIDTHLKEIAADKSSRTMTYNEVLELLSIKQIILQKPILKGSMPKQQRRGTNVQTKRT